MRITRIIITVIFVLTSAFTETLAQNQSLLKAAFELFNGNPVKAEKELADAVVAHEDKSYYYELAGRTAFNSIDYQKAFDYWSQRAQMPHPEQSWFELAKLSFRLNDKTQAYDYLKKYLESGHYESVSAIQADAAFSGLSESREWISFWSGKWYTEKEDLMNEARAQLKRDFPSDEVFTRLERDYSSDPKVQILLGQFYVRSGRKSKANQHASRASSQLQSSDFRSMLALGRLFEEIGDVEQAIRVYDQILKNNPYRPEIWMKLVELQTAHASLVQVDYMQMLSASQIVNHDISLAIARSKIDTKPQEALETMNRLLDEDPLNHSAWNLRAELYTNLGNREAAIIDYTQSLDVNPHQNRVYFNRAKLRFDLGDSDGACHDWKKALQYGNRKALIQLQNHCGY